jgi:hypothetical protein
MMMMMMMMMRRRRRRRMHLSDLFVQHMPFINTVK